MKEKEYPMLAEYLVEMLMGSIMARNRILMVLGA